MSRYSLGFTQGTFDLFHVGHLRLIERARKLCDALVVGVNADALVKEYKNTEPVIPEQDRMSIVASLKGVNDVRLCTTLDKMTVWEEIGFDVLVIGDDWKGNPRWVETEKTLAKVGVDVMFLPYTQGISSSSIRSRTGRRVSDTGTTK